MVTLILLLLKFYLFTFVSSFFFGSSWYILLFELCYALIIACLIVTVASSIHWHAVKDQFKEVAKLTIFGYIVELFFGYLFSLLNNQLLQHSVIQVSDPKVFLFVSTVYFLYSSVMLDSVLKLIRSQLKDMF